MSIRDMEVPVDDKIPVNYVLVSVFDKERLELLIPKLVEMNPAVRFMSTGGTYRKVEEILGQRHLIEVAEYTEFPEMEGGLVKTLHPKIHAGLLGERNNPKHKEYLRNLTKTIEFVDNDYIEGVFDAEVGNTYKVRVIEGHPGVFIDLVVVNLYPFSDVIKQKDVTFEKARGHIDIGGPTMIRAAAKNFPSVAVLSHPAQYEAFLKQLEENDGCTTFMQRLNLASKVFDITSKYDATIAFYINAQKHKDPNGIRACYDFGGGE